MWKLILQGACSPAEVGQLMVSVEKAAPKSVVQPAVGVNEGHSTQ